MDGISFNIFWIFLVGVLSFFSPCNFALIPTFIAYIAGSTSTQKLSRRDVIVPTIFFVLGFMLIFLLLGVGAGALSVFLTEHRNTLRVVGGLVIVLIGLVFLFHLNFKIFKRDFHLTLPQKFVNYPRLKAFLAGLAIAFGWSPCYGPLIGAIFTLVLTTGSTTQGALYFFVYSLGFVVPFILIALCVDACTRSMKRMRQYLKYFHIVSGLLLIIIGGIIIADNVGIFTDWLYRLYDSLNIPYIS